MAHGECRDPLEHTSLYQRADSEDSDTEGGLGNVNKMIMRPPGHSGKAKKGHICFDASFETGNLGRVELVSEFEYDLFVRPDTCNPRLRFWFNFTVDNVKADQRVVFNIVNISRSRNLFRDGMTPLVKSSSRPRWQRIPGDQVFYYISREHQNHYVLSFGFSFDREEDVYQFALTYPYSYSRHLAHLDNLCARRGCARRETLATSIQKRKIELITITAGPDDEPTERPRRAVVIIARTHPAESPSSFVCQGLMDFLVSSHPIARVLRNFVVFKIVPMLNPDGVFLGNYRSTAMGADLNRTWNKTSEWLHPALVAMKPMLKNLDKSSRTPLDCVLDLHGHINAMGIFVYGNTYDDVYRYERHIVLPKLLAQHTDGYEAGNAMYNQDPHRAGTARRYLCSVLRDHVNCYSLEVSMYGYRRKAMPGIFPYTEEGYYRLGRNLARVLLEYYKAMGIIASGLPDQPSSKRSRQSRPRHRVQREPRPKTSRKPAPIHFASIHEYLEEETEAATSGGYRSMSGTRMGRSQSQRQRQLETGTGSGTGVGGCRNRSYRFRSPGAPRGGMQALYRRPVEPRLTIIDFNQLTRGGLELATSKNRAKVARKAGKSNG